MPETLHGYAYYWPACGNAALAAMTRSFFTNATPANKASVDSLENALNDALSNYKRIMKSFKGRQILVKLLHKRFLTGRRTTEPPMPMHLILHPLVLDYGHPHLLHLQQLSDLIGATTV